MKLQGVPVISFSVLHFPTFKSSTESVNIVMRALFCSKLSKGQQFLLLCSVSHTYILLLCALLSPPTTEFLSLVGAKLGFIKAILFLWIIHTYKWEIPIILALFVHVLVQLMCVFGRDLEYKNTNL